MGSRLVVVRSVVLSLAAAVPAVLALVHTAGAAPTPGCSDPDKDGDGHK